MADASPEDSAFERARRLTIAMTASRMKSICCRLQLHSARLCAVPPHYYSLTLQQRAALVAAASVNHMCKTVVFENTKATVADCQDPFHSRFYAVIVQYVRQLPALQFCNNLHMYECSIDVRELVSVEDVMVEMNLGPNGGLVYANVLFAH